jgi:hypothetical protein
MIEPLPVDLPARTLELLQFIADVGVIGDSPADVVRHLVFRGLQDMVRDGVLQLTQVPA